MPLLLPRRVFLQSVFAGAASGALAAPRARPRPDEPGTPFLLEGGRILVEAVFATPGGGLRKALAFFNMGMGRTALTPALFAELSLDRGAPLRYTLADAEFETGAGTVDVTKADFTGLGLDQMFAPHKVEAILSPSLLLDRQLILDYGRRRLAFAASTTQAPDGVQVPIDLNAQTGLCSVEAEVAGELWAFVVDAGSGYCWMRCETMKKWLAAAPDWRRVEGAVGRANYNMIDFAFEKQGTIARLPEMAIGELSLAQLGVMGTGPLLGGYGDALVGEVFWDNWQKSAPGPIVGWLGANALRQFKITIDYVRRMSYWRRQSAPDPHDLDQPGLTLVRRDGRYFIGGLVRPAQGAPLAEARVGDELLAIGGLNARGAGKEAILTALHARPGESRTLRISGADGPRTIEAPILDLS